MGRRHRRRSHRRSHRVKDRRRDGWGMNLYRNTRDAKIAGVCAGLADHWDVEHWVIRLAAVILLLFTGALAFWAYIAGWVLLKPRPRRGRREADLYMDEFDDETVDMEYDERVHDYRPRRMFKYGESASVRLQRARERLDAALSRVEDMESYVTSRQYNLNKEFSKL